MCRSNMHSFFGGRQSKLPFTLEKMCTRDIGIGRVA
jgi:hypothetical protein